VESPVTQLQANLEQSFCSNLRVLRRGQEHDYSEMNTGDIASNLGEYQDFLWTLQQQVAYLSSLLNDENLSGKDPEMEVIRDLLFSLFGELDDDRTLYLFIALLKLICAFEIRHSKTLEDVFASEHSKFFLIFRDFAVRRPEHYERVVHKFMECQPPPGKQGKYEKRSIAGKVFEITEQMNAENLILALTPEQYRDGLVKLGYNLEDRATRLQKFNEMLVQFFKDLVRITLVAAIEEGCKDLHPNIRRLFIFIVRKIKERRFQTGANKNKNVTEDEAQYEPILRLLVMGIIVPILREPAKYGSTPVGLGRNEAGLKEEVFIWNLSVIEEFLTKMISDTFDDKSRFVKELAMDKVKPELLKLCHNRLMGDVEDDTDTQLIVSFFTSHYDRVEHTVSVPGVTLMRLSNMCKDRIAKLKINEKDALADIIEPITHWTEEQIEQAKNDDILYNFVIENRFLFRSKAVTICGTSRCPVPPELSASRGAGAKVQLVRKMRGDEEEGGENNFRELELLFIKLPPLKATNFQELEEELNEECEKATNPQSPDYMLAHSIKKVLDFVKGDLVRLEAVPADVLDEMAGKVHERSAHLSYLTQLEDIGIKIIEEKKKAHEVALQKDHEALSKAYGFSRELQLPRGFAGGVQGQNLLKFTKHKRDIERDGFGRSKQFKGEGLAFAPTKTYSLKDLEKAIGLTILDKGFEDERTSGGECFLTLALINGGLDITVSLRRKEALENVDSIVLVVKYSEDDLRDLRRSDAKNKVRLQGSRRNPLMECSSAALLREVARLANPPR
jgi:hypothetical protein